MKAKKIKTQKIKALKSKKISVPKSEVEARVTPMPTPPPEFHIPAGYGDNRIVLMTRDPWWIYAYWEIKRQKEEEIRNTVRAKGFDNPKSVLRVYDVTDIDFTGSNAHSFFDIELKGLANNWYIEVGKPNRSWVADIGLLTPPGDFFLLARSNCVRTPRFGMSEVTDEEWFSPAEDYWKMFGVAGGGKLGQSSIELKELVEKKIKEQISSGAISSLFSLRFSLPDGEQIIPVKAVSSDKKEEKTITPIVTKKTI